MLTRHVNSAGADTSKSEVCPLTIGVVIDFEERTTVPGGESLLFFDEPGRCDDDRF
jgi:hypothetical protein